MEPKTKLGKFRKATSGKGNKNFDTDVIRELEETIKLVNDE